MDKYLAGALDEEVNKDGVEKKWDEDQKRVKPLLTRGVLVKEESQDYPGQGHHCQGQENGLPLSPGILVNGFPLCSTASP